MCQPESSAPTPRVADGPEITPRYVPDMLHVHRAERADRLADGLAETLLAPLEDPFAPDVVAVPTRGIERWLTQRLSTRLGASETGGTACARTSSSRSPAG